jgi:hypothetical protein
MNAKELGPILRSAYGKALLSKSSVASWEEAAKAALKALKPTFEKRKVKLTYLLLPDWAVDAAQTLADAALAADAERWT